MSIAIADKETVMEMPIRTYSAEQLALMLTGSTTTSWVEKMVRTGQFPHLRVKRNEPRFTDEHVREIVAMLKPAPTGKTVDVQEPSEELAFNVSSRSRAAHQRAS